MYYCHIKISGLPDMNLRKSAGGAFYLRNSFIRKSIFMIILISMLKVLGVSTGTLSLGTFFSEHIPFECV